MSGFNVNNQMAGSLQAIGTAYHTLTRVVSAASNPRRIRMMEAELSIVSVPNSTDCDCEFDFTYCGATAAGTSTAATPLPQDSGAAIGTQIDTAVSTGAVNFTAGNEPTTFTQADCWYNRGVNQRSGILWQASPGREIIQPSTASIGAAWRALSPNFTGNIIAREMFDEL